MKLEWKTCFRAGVTLFLLYLAVYYWGFITKFFLLLAGAAFPLVLGGVFAYMINIMMTMYEENFFPKTKKEWLIKSRHIICMLLAIFTLIGAIVLIALMIIPEIGFSIQTIIDELPKTIMKLMENEAIASHLPNEVEEWLTDFDWNTTISRLMQFLSGGIGSAVDTAAGVISSVFSGTITVVFAAVFAIYLLVGKKKLQKQAIHIMKVYLPENAYKSVLYVLTVTNDCFHSFVVGQVLEAIIIGVLCGVGMTLLKFPYAVVVGTLIGFTALIPIAGAYIGAFVGAFMILTVSPIKAVLFLVFIVCLQQFEDNLIYPRVVGTSMGLPAIWVLAAITVGGSLLGIAGMFIGVPVAATLYQLLRNDLHRKEAQMTVQEAMEAEVRQYGQKKQEKQEKKMNRKLHRELIREERQKNRRSNSKIKRKRPPRLKDTNHSGPEEKNKIFEKK